MRSKNMESTSWRQNICHKVKKYVITSKVWKVHHDIKRKFVMTSKRVTTPKKFIMTLKHIMKPKTSWRQKACHNVKKTRHDVKKDFMTHNTHHYVKNDHHDVKNTPWRQKKFVIMSKTVIMPKRSSWRQMHVMTSNSSSWRQKHIMALHQTYRHDVQTYAVA